jgi:hypothetical protein
MRLLSNGGIINNNCVCIIYMTDTFRSIFNSRSKVAPAPTPTKPEAFKYILVWTGPVMEPAEAKSFEIRETTREEQDHLNYISKNGITTQNQKFIGDLKPDNRAGTENVYQYYKVDHNEKGFTTANINESYFVSSDTDPDVQKDMLKKYKTSLNNEKRERLNPSNGGGKKTKRRTSKRRKTVSNKKNKRA